VSAFRDGNHFQYKTDIKRFSCRRRPPVNTSNENENSSPIGFDDNINQSRNALWLPLCFRCQNVVVDVCNSSSGVRFFDCKGHTGLYMCPPSVQAIHSFSPFEIIGRPFAYNSPAVAEMGDRLATIDMARKVWGGCCAPFGGGSWVPI